MRASSGAATFVVLGALILASCTSGEPRDQATEQSASPSPVASSSANPTPGSSQPPIYSAEIKVGAEPGYATVGAGSVWVGNHLGQSVSRLDPSTDVVTATIKIRGEPTGMLFAFGDVWTFGAMTGLLHRIDADTDKVVARVKLRGDGGAINGLAADGSSLWASETSGLVYRIDPAADKIAGTVKIVKGGCGPAGNLTFSAGAIWYTCWDYPFLWKIDPATQQIVQKIRIGGMAGSPAEGDGIVWVPRMDNGVILGIDPTTDEVQRRVKVGSQVEQLRVAGKTMWARVSDTELAKVDLKRMKVVDRFELPDAPIPGGGLTLGFGSVWVVNFGTGTVWRLKKN